jgi:regulatory protein
LRIALAGGKVLRTLNVRTRARVDAVTKAVELLAGQERSEAQVLQALQARGYPDPEVAAALQRVRELGYLDDRRVAQARSRRFFAEGKSFADARRRLEAQGIDPTLALACAEEAAAAAGHSDEAAARKLLAQRKLSGLKAARLLASRGFEEELISALVGIDSPGEEL